MKVILKVKNILIPSPPPPTQSTTDPLILPLQSDEIREPLRSITAYASLKILKCE